MKKTIYALGVFDGVHVGHAQLLRQCRELGRQFDCQSGAVTFGTHPDMQVFGRAPVLINSLSEREMLLKTFFQMDTVVVLPFDEHMRSMPWQDFLVMLQQHYHAAGFVCGEDFCFGRGGQGTAALLEDYCRTQGLPCAVVPEQSIDGIRVSSTYIRRLLEQGELCEATRFLGHPHFVTGRVDAFGKLHLPTGIVVPKPGRYQVDILDHGTRSTALVRLCADSAIEIANAANQMGKEVTLEFIRFLDQEP